MTRISVLFAGFVALAAAGAALAEPLSTEEALKERILGNPEAPITIIEFASLTCPHCARFHVETLPRLKEDWLDTGKAKLVYRDFPTSPVALAVYGAMVARCAPEGRYFKFLNVLYKQQQSWTSDPDPVKALSQLARLGGMSEADFKTCTENEALFTGIREKALDGQMEYDIKSTPSFVIGGEVIRGAMSYEDLDDILKGVSQ